MHDHTHGEHCNHEVAETVTSDVASVERVSLTPEAVLNTALAVKDVLRKLRNRRKKKVQLQWEASTPRRQLVAKAKRKSHSNRVKKSKLAAKTVEVSHE